MVCFLMYRTDVLFSLICNRNFNNIMTARVFVTVGIGSEVIIIDYIVNSRSRITIYPEEKLLNVAILMVNITSLTM